MGAKDRTEGGAPTPFPKTTWSGILAARDRSSPQYVERVNRLAKLYWRPVYWYIRLYWNRSHEECKDLTQEFFVQMLEHDVFRLADPRRGSFRAFLKAVLKHFLLVAKRAKGRIKRGGGKKTIALEMDEIHEARVLAAPERDAPEKTFDREWSRAILDEAYRQLEQEAFRESKAEAFEAFRTYYLEPRPGAAPSYKDVARSLGISEFQLQNHLYAMRQKLKRIVRELVTESVRAPEEIESEMRELLLE